MKTKVPFTTVVFRSVAPSCKFSFILRLVLLCLVSLILLGGCAYERGGDWSLLAQTPKYVSYLFTMMEIDPTDNSIWAAYPLLPFFEHVWDDGTSVKFEKIALSQNGGIVDLCVADKVWLILNDFDGGYSIDAYDPHSNTFSSTNLPIEPKNGRLLACKILDNKLTIWSGDEIATYSGTWNVEIVPEIDNPIFGIVEDSQGKKWLLLENGKLYKRGDGAWLLVGQINGLANEYPEISIFSVTSGDTLWIGTSTCKLYQWKDIEISPTLSQNLALVPPCADNMSPYYVIASDTYGTVWIVGGFGVWVYESDGKISNVSLPDETNTLGGAVFDETQNRLYVSTALGIYYR
jgi:hypothetical protein